MKPRIVTIGVYGFDKESFFQALLDAKVDTFCDIRMRRGMRGSTYAFVNSISLGKADLNNYLMDCLSSIIRLATFLRPGGSQNKVQVTGFQIGH